jgi:hypothetical protein
VLKPFYEGGGGREKIMEGMNQCWKHANMEMSQQNLPHNYHVLIKCFKKSSENT